MHAPYRLGSARSVTVQRSVTLSLPTYSVHKSRRKFAWRLTTAHAAQTHLGVRVIETRNLNLVRFLCGYFAWQLPQPAECTSEIQKRSEPSGGRWTQTATRGNSTLSKRSVAMPLSLTSRAPPVYGFPSGNACEESPFDVPTREQGKRRPDWAQ